MGISSFSEENRRIVLSMSAATADRLLRVSVSIACGVFPQQKLDRCSSSRSLFARLRIGMRPHRVFWKWTWWLIVVPPLWGSFLYTLTLTDVATGWTECLPVLNRGREEVLAGLQRARTLFPFPVLGIDTDNGGEFLNGGVAAYCAHEQITFTRGRPYEKRDQCFIEQKNGVVVRQVVGRDRLEGEHAARQLTGTLSGAAPVCQLLSALDEAPGKRV